MVVRCKECGCTIIVLKGKEMKTIEDTAFVSADGKLESMHFDELEARPLIRYTKVECYECGSSLIEDLDELQTMVKRYLSNCDIEFELGGDDGD